MKKAALTALSVIGIVGTASVAFATNMNVLDLDLADDVTGGATAIIPVADGHQLQMVTPTRSGSGSSATPSATPDADVAPPSTLAPAAPPAPAAPAAPVAGTVAPSQPVVVDTTTGGSAVAGEHEDEHEDEYEDEEHESEDHDDD